MNIIDKSCFKGILHSKRANVYYLEYCRVLVNGGRVEYVTQKDKSSFYWNIPIANTTFILLGSGTSITQAAMRELSKAGVMVGFCGGGGSPLFSGTETEIDISWISPQSEYRPTEYLQKWIPIWTCSDKRVAAAVRIQKFRVNFIKKIWIESSILGQISSKIEDDLSALLKRFEDSVQNSSDNQSLMLAEARFTKSLYRLIANELGFGEFKRAKQGAGLDFANKFLDQGNYLAYGLGAIATWVLGIPHSLSVLHGKTRRGGLVFDVADIIKDALVLPQAFLSAAEGECSREFRQECIQNFHQYSALDEIIDCIKLIINDLG